MPTTQRQKDYQVSEAENSSGVAESGSPSEPKTDRPPGYAATMLLLINSTNRQMAGFTIATVGWILTTTSTGLVEWRVWYMNNSSLFPSGLVCVGMWKVCIYQYITNFNRATLCHRYTYHDTYLPLDIRISQNLLLVATILGLLGRAAIIFALRNVYMGIHQDATFNPFIVSGILNVVAGVCISITVVWNFYSVINEEGITFPPSLYIPFKPDSQEIGSALLVACLAAFMMLLSGLLFLSYKRPPARQIHPETSEM
ncbi:claudin-34 [Vulpes vulpes]|uniref:Claudin-34 n=2 Tax=Vulpes TaxID=9625 RepID=A0A3Q7T2E8_VULVU|nr:claudin-34 [Vulpes vulpes]XP_025871088.1 claudin-34 [Vulpes vulpes]XP_025871089.1 claudin-34 [Vulpes vulpes]XP_041598194.1 claudin-34-like [Vulpes lagopus]XP_041598195.1 claudin-34-like [Vulpes lagopus]XP_041598196.1 claudin-34-like [Vulpes lagopus]XP_041598197.1 claudin-34-like [Vulpes lagopus]XP_041598199.1 claudin-34-like [Vulpes lagopus]